ncbi:MFS general substrate transporter [Myriangium duriaei CBS 260.36]|uniref:MFS general substrate transporter n=1 Tax=Myriangium duriaei CBS 260.36 TaxID=1168546 RepID=A0A9P4JA84_9PEZI|nr:MFS general substrate transporter [Myriangium duriaei CBS 260.36]
MYRILPAFTASPLNITAYLGGIALFSISFLVFLNASLSFVITDVLGRRSGVGNAVGTLGFADELVALVACPLWGLVSDRIGVRWVAVAGYCVIGLSLICLVQSAHVYPDLVIWRMVFSIGGAACTTMVTAILPSMTAPRNDAPSDLGNATGFVGMFTGIGALVALAVFLPLPTLLGTNVTKAQAVKNSFYIVGAVAFFVAIFVGLGLRGLPGEDNKGLQHLFRYSMPPSRKHTQLESGPPSTTPDSDLTYLDLVRSAVILGFTDSNVALGYIGGFVARASSVGISSFIPLFVNAYFIREGICTDDPGDEIRRSCERAYKLASMLTGISQLVALLAAPLYGFFNARYARQRFASRVPLALAAVAGIVGYVVFGQLRSPDPKISGGQAAILAVILIGLSQIGAIVCSLGVLAQGIQASSSPASAPKPSSDIGRYQGEDAPLLETAPPSSSGKSIDRSRLKGSIAGVYSLAGGAAILLLTKLGGHLFDVADPGAPFYLLAGFNAVLLVAVVGISTGTAVKHSVSERERDSAEDRPATVGEEAGPRLEQS